jgi:hypothetical protein
VRRNRPARPKPWTEGFRCNEVSGNVSISIVEVGVAQPALQGKPWPQLHRGRPRLPAVRGRKDGSPEGNHTYINLRLQ